MKLAHKPKPEIVPIIGPKVFSMYTYAPPEEGIAEASSDLEMAPGKITNPANKYANHIPPKGDSPPPNSIIAKEGSTNNPLPNIADKDNMTTENNPNFLSKVSDTLSIGCRTIPSTSLGDRRAMNYGDKTGV
tara:strand:- start:662 stop:1057 length:396 start_codon:yes stop_codon:yes gene_type:complete